MQEGLGHVELGDGVGGKEGDVEDGLGVWDLDGYGVAAGRRGCEEGGGDSGVVWRGDDADGGERNCWGCYDFGALNTLVSFSCMNGYENGLRCCL